MGIACQAPGNRNTSFLQRGEDGRNASAPSPCTHTAGTPRTRRCLPTPRRGCAARPRTAPRHTPTQDGGAAVSPAWAPEGRRPEGLRLTAQVGGRAAAVRGERGGAEGRRWGAAGRAFGTARLCVCGWGERCCGAVCVGCVRVRWRGWARGTYLQEYIPYVAAWVCGGGGCVCVNRYTSIYVLVCTVCL